MSLSERTAVPEQRAVPIARSAVAASAEGSPATAVCTASLSQPAYFAVATMFGVASIAALVPALLH